MERESVDRDQDDFIQQEEDYYEYEDLDIEEPSEEELEEYDELDFDPDKQELERHSEVPVNLEEQW